MSSCSPCYVPKRSNKRVPVQAHGSQPVGLSTRAKTKEGSVYKLLLCWRYLLTRYLALACIISVMLGVATLIVVNSVMSGFSTKLKERLHGILSDVIIEGYTLDGFGGAAAKMQRIRESPIGSKIEAMAPTVEIFAILQYPFPNGEMNTRIVRLIG